MRMQDGQRLGALDLTSAPNDDVTYLGLLQFPLLCHDNLMTIFRPFVTQDGVQRAYQEHESGWRAPRRS
jgi:hypothetical protein